MPREATFTVKSSGYNEFRTWLATHGCLLVSFERHTDKIVARVWAADDGVFFAASNRADEGEATWLLDISASSVPSVSNTNRL